MCTQKNKLEDVTYRDELRKLINESHCRLVDAVEGFNSQKAIKPINKDALKVFPFMRWFPLNDKVKIRRRANRFGTYMCFDTKMQEGGQFGEHFHDDIIESTEVIYGELMDTSDNNKLYNDGDVAHYEKGIKHTPIATKETLLHVLFKP